MNLGELLTQLRLELSDTINTVSPTSAMLSNDALWPDSQLVNYLNWAEREFATRTGFYRDTTSAITSIPLVVGQVDYPLDQRILSVLSVSLNAPQNFPVSSMWPMSYADMDPAVRTEFNGVQLQPASVYSDTYGIPEQVQTPLPLGWATDKAANTLTIFPAWQGYWPANWNTTPQMNLRVERLPYNSFNPNLLTQVPGIPIQYHLALVWGAAWQALLTTDVDGYAPAQAATFQQRFEMEILSARRDMMRRMRIKPVVQVGSMGRW
ncbi:MAG: hypothetical protein ACP5D5_08900 [Acidithiobacillus sp.]|uniref:phage adaptor protein n=1 Tax=Acidithiobacillus sp. TaxID=1872118 RepID=UPI003CFC9601